MEKPLFSNVISIKSSKEKISLFLKNPETLLKWIPDIIQVQPIGNNNFSIYRTDSALNKNEEISVSSKNDTIYYESTGGKLKYTLIFNLTSKNATTLLEENFYLSENEHSHLPLKLLMPIAKHAFNSNLQSFKRIIENN